MQADAPEYQRRTPADATLVWLLSTLVEISIVVFCLIPGVFFALQAVVEPDTLFRLAHSLMALQTNHISGSGTAFKGGAQLGADLIQIAVLSTTAWHPEAVAAVPIGSFVLVLIYGGLARALTRSRWIAGATMIYAGWFYPVLFTQYSTQTGAWTVALFLSFTLALVSWLAHRSPIVAAMIALIFCASLIQPYSTPFWLIIAITVALALSTLSGRLSRPLPLIRALPIPLVLFALYVIYDTLVYGSLLARIRNTSALSSFLFQATSVTPVTLLRSVLAGTQPFGIGPGGPWLASLTTICILVLLLVPVLVWIVFTFGRAVLTLRPGALVNGTEQILIWTVLGVAVADALIDAPSGAWSLRIVPLAFPLLIPLLSKESRSGAAIARLLMTTIAVLAVVGFLSVAPTLQPQIVADQTGVAAKLLQPDHRVLSDPAVYGALAVNAAEASRSIDFTPVDAAAYKAVTTNQPVTSNSWDYVAIDRAGKPVPGPNASMFAPWTEHLAQIEQNSSYNKIYDSEHLFLLQNAAEPLSNYQLGAADITPSQRYDAADVLRLVVVVLALFFVPGAVTYFLLWHVAHWRLADLRAALALMIGLSLAFTTLIGALVNLTPLGLTWFVPLCWAIPWLTLGLYFVVRRPNIAVDPVAINFFAALGLVMLIWAVLVVQVSDQRAAGTAPYTEFFVTRSTEKATTLDFSVVNRQPAPQHLTMVFSIDGDDVQTVGPIDLDPAAVWTVNWLAAETTGRPLTVSLRKDDEPYRQLVLHNPQVAAIATNTKAPGPLIPFRGLSYTSATKSPSKH